MMTEPDLVSIDDYTCVDAASVICHLNTRGEFSLTPLIIGKFASLRAASRLTAGAQVCGYAHTSKVDASHTLTLSCVCLLIIMAT